MAKYANIIVDISMEKLDKTFQYLIPEVMQPELQIGMQVEIPFGSGNRYMTGYVVELTDEAEFDPQRMKEITGITDKGVQIESRLIALAGWIRRTYGSTMNQALKTVIPIRQKMKEKQKRSLRLLLSTEEARIQLELFERKHQTARLRLLAALMDTPVLDHGMATEKLHVTAATIQTFEEMGILQIESETVYRNPIPKSETGSYQLELNGEQQYIVDSVMEDYARGDRTPCLIHGVTGSGKTEVYMELIASVIEKGREAIVLIPEIALTYQTVMRFYQRFGNKVSIMNSRLSAGERFDQFERAKKGKIKVMIGPRSALFTPFQNLGMIVIDEEHEGSYKSENVPRYHAREVAIERARMEDAFVVLGSATPSVDSYYKAQTNEYRLYEMKKRVSDRPLPGVSVVDLREELREGNRSIISRKLRELMEERLEKKQQMMLFINRRGYAGFVSCRACGHVLKCPHCDVSLSLHNNGKMVCHYCGHEEVASKKCPSCGSSYIGAFRAGTQQIEEVVRREFPGIRTLRMDMDTTRNKDGHQKILAAFAGGEADVLIGTQMIVKGHDFPEVTLVGILAADLSLYANDYRAAERTFQLLTQASGRAGRGSEPGEVVIQTYSPEHYSVIAAANQDYQEFFNQEILYRKLAEYPPAAHILAIYIAAKDEDMLEIAAAMLRDGIDRVNQSRVRVIGPSDAVIAKVNDTYKKVIYMKSEQQEHLIAIKDQLESFINHADTFQKINIQFDMNPMTGY